MKIEWTEPALFDVESIRDYIKRDSVYYSARFVERIFGAIENLRKFPELGRHVPESEDKNIREIMLQNYRIVYRAESERILILAVIHGARDLSQSKSKPWDIT
jgi:toxin ParE1/3/4